MSHFKKPNNYFTQKMQRAREEEEAELEEYRRHRKESSPERRPASPNPRKPYWK